MDTRSTHLLVELHDCNPATLNDAVGLERAMVEAVRAAGATVVARLFHRFSPQGVTGVIVVEESHFSIHTWPERGYAAADFFTCGTCEPHRAVAVIVEALAAKRHDCVEVARGLNAEPSLSIAPAEALSCARREPLPREWS